MSKNHILFTLFSVLLIACSSPNKQSAETRSANEADSLYKVNYATGFEVNVFDDCKQVIVKDPWDSTKVLQKYVLVDKNIDVPANLPEGTLVRTPLSDVLAYSTIHCSIIDEIGEAQTIKGVCDPQYISVASIISGLKDGSVKELGQPSNPNKELMIELEPGAIFVEPIAGRSNELIKRMGIPVIETPDYMEASPLGRAEWIRFYGLFFDKETYADSLFSITVQNYDAIKSKVANVSHRPTVFIDLMYRSVWYVSGGDSFISKMINDAGGTYLWYDDNSIAAKQLSFEQVFDKASDADMWLIKYNAPQLLTYQGLEKEYQPYSYFGAYKNKNIYECNTATKKYYQDLPIHPEYILEDFAYTFHPDLFPDYTPRYYNRMQ